MDLILVIDGEFPTRRLVRDHLEQADYRVLTASDIETGLRKGPAAYELVPCRREAVEAAIAQAEAGDVLVVAGKGHENYQIIGGDAFPFDDREVARELSGLGEDRLAELLDPARQATA